MVYLISIQPKYSQAIFGGLKTFELRKNQILLKNPREIFIVYESTPTKSLVGYFIAPSILYKPLAELWSLIKDASYVSRQEFDDYFQGKRYGSAIKISEPSLFTTPIHLEAIRKRIPNWMPPQNMVKISTKDEPFNSLIRTEIQARHQKMFFDVKTLKDFLRPTN